MSKSFLLIATMAVVMLFTSASNNSNGKDGIVGRAASDFTVSNSQGTVRLSQLRGQYVLLTLWSSADALSRLDNIRHDRYASQPAGLVTLSVNFDRSEALFGELVAADSLDASTQYYCQAQDRAVFAQQWGTARQYNSYLIGPSGTVIAVNPTSQEITRLVK